MAGVFLAVVHVAAPALEERAILQLAREKSERKDSGIVWQRAAFASPKIAPLYGSSELTISVKYTPQAFFATLPTGFAVSSVGHAGCTSLTLAQKIAAAGSTALPGRRIAVIVSPSWFFTPGVSNASYRHNFSPPQVSALLCNPRLGPQLKRDLALRMLDFPKALADYPLLELLLHHVARQELLDKAIVSALLPLAKLGTTLVETSEHGMIAWQILTRPDPVEPSAQKENALDWKTLLARTDHGIIGDSDHRDHDGPRISDNDAFLNVMQHSVEWGDLELLLRTTQELGLSTSLLEIPVDYNYYRQNGIAEASLEKYETLLHDLACRYHVQLVRFPDHQQDRAFFLDHYDHLSAKGWMYFDQALDFIFSRHPSG